MTTLTRAALALSLAFAAAGVAESAEPASAAPLPVDPKALVQAAFEHARGEASFARMRMTIHRPEWERSQELEAWTRGEKDAVIILVEPARDRGNGTLKRANRMWTFNPRINRVIALPASLMGQSWMGSDFTNHDLAKSDTVLVDYEHELAGTQEADGHTVHHIRLTPKPGAPVVWGSEDLFIRDDFVVVEERFNDQEGRLVKRLVASEIQLLDGRMLPRVVTMVQADDLAKFTRMEYLQFEFRDEIPESTFTEAFLRNPRR